MSTVVLALEVPKACEVMNELGFENAFNLTGGILAWNGDIVSPE